MAWTRDRRHDLCSAIAYALAAAGFGFIQGCIPIAGLAVAVDSREARVSNDERVAGAFSPTPLSLVKYEEAASPPQASPMPAGPPAELITTPPTPESRTANTTASSQPASAGASEIMPIDLVTALHLANSSNPTIEVARARVQAAYYRQRQAEVLWVPNLQAGPAYNRHDGLIQNSLGLVFPTSKWNFFIGGGATADLRLNDALFLPLVAQRLTDAEAARARATTDDVQLDVALTYQDLLEVFGRLAVNAEAQAYADEMLRFAEAGREAQMGKTPADVTRARTEVNLRREERLDLEGRAAEVSARLAQLLLLRPTVDLRPAEPALVPIALVDPSEPLENLIATALLNRPELAESRSLVRAALARWRQARAGPLLPRLEVSYLAGDFGGGLTDGTERFGGRGDGTAQAVWEFHNLGLGDVARARERRTEFREANLHVTEIEAQVAAEVTAAAKVARTHQQALTNAQVAVQQAEETWRRLHEAAFGIVGRDRRYDPLEPLIAEQQVSDARNRYVAEIIGYNKAQFRLYAYMGQPPLNALPQATSQPVEIPAEPTLPVRPRGLPKLPVPAPAK
jgi:outer membrane protein TolC